MITLYMPKPDMPKALTHTASDWELATDPSFKKDTIVASSRDDEDHLTSIVFDVDLDPNKTYYARSRVQHDKGVFEWSSVDIIKVHDFIKLAFDYPVPSMVMKPKIELSHSATKLPTSLFNVKTSPMSTTSNAEHKKTMFIIETLDGQPIYTNLDEQEDLTDILIDKLVLEEGKPYIIKAAHVSSSGDTSEFAEELIFTRSIPEIILKSNLKNPNLTDGYNVTIKDIKDFKTMYVNMYAVGIGDAKHVFSDSRDDLTLNIPKKYFSTYVTNYIIGIKIKYKNGDITDEKYYILQTLDSMK